MFDRQPALRDYQIINYRADNNQKWLCLIGIAQQEGTFVYLFHPFPWFWNFFFFFFFEYNYIPLSLYFMQDDVYWAIDDQLPLRRIKILQDIYIFFLLHAISLLHSKLNPCRTHCWTDPAVFDREADVSGDRGSRCRLRSLSGLRERSCHDSPDFCLANSRPVKGKPLQQRAVLVRL